MSSSVRRVLSRKGAISRTFCNSSLVKVETSKYECLWTREEISDFSSTKGGTSLTIDWLEGEAIWLLDSLKHCTISPSYSDKFSKNSTLAWAWKTSLIESTEDWKNNSELDFLETETGESNICFSFILDLCT